MKHSYNATCECNRCAKERARRGAQSAAAPKYAPPVRRRRVRQSGLERWAQAYYDSEGGIDQFDPNDR